ncbi:PREDICTED: uncharacterized protein LOC104602843 [Nelumbo nucifera]|uniref:Uncharacterized protein LOC104602843 n=2 Tax=Nelumbo nucifera TaxID=4432 RepID=A0A1U8AQM8_NELNU|nr:PREDICTED: uncharacterized protein LOC104602843 [Nelumbo nucifera]DAD19963.1 TPA_asm: hypothetical protein HUJ06_021426 [Nelumbo nucifera]
MLSTERSSSAMSNNHHHHPRRVLTPGVSRKRKEREGFDAHALKVSTTTTTASKEEPASANKLLAGYLAQEFLRKGTLLGQKWDPARAEATPIESRKPNPGILNHHHHQQKAAEAAELKPPTRNAAASVKHPSYDDVARLLKADGTHIAGIVNPKQLAEWLQMRGTRGEQG